MKMRSEHIRAAALLLLEHVLKTECDARADDNRVLQIQAEVWCLLNGIEHDPLPGGLTDMPANEMIKMLTPEWLEPEKRLYRCAFLLCTVAELSQENETLEKE